MVGVLILVALSILEITVRYFNGVGMKRVLLIAGLLSVTLGYAETLRHEIEESFHSGKFDHKFILCRSEFGKAQVVMHNATQFGARVPTMMLDLLAPADKERVMALQKQAMAEESKLHPDEKVLRNIISQSQAIWKPVAESKEYNVRMEKIDNQAQAYDKQMENLVDVCLAKV